MSRVRRALAASVVPLLALTACTTDPGTSTSDDGGPAFGVDVDVDTPQLRDLKKEAGVAPCPADQTGTPVEGGMPDLVLPCLGGGPDVNLASLRGPMVVNLWAQWCGPCREELPYYQELHERAGDKVDVVGLDWQDTRPELALELAKETGVTYPLVADPGAETRVPFRIRGLPGVVFVDAEGRVTHTEFVVIRSYDQLADLVEEHLDVTV
ncbi:MAG: TlpA family protein disulfide reductase [Nocardioidaceae bacterium]